MLNNLLPWLRSNAPFLFQEKMPVWFTILVGLAAGGVTYIVSPMLNRQFQLDSTRSAQIAKTTDGLNSQIIALSKEIRRLTDALTNDPAAAPAIRGRCYDLITEMQWRLVDLRVVLSDEDDIKVVDDLASAIRGVQDSLDKAVDSQAEPTILKSMDKLGQSTEAVLYRLYVRSALKQNS
jgi:hypothetical protein